MKLKLHDGWGEVYGPAIDIEDFTDAWGDPCIAVSHFIGKTADVAEEIIERYNNYESLRKNLEHAREWAQWWSSCRYGSKPRNRVAIYGWDGLMCT